MKAFEDIERTCTNHKTSMISDYGYLNVSARSEAGKIRDLINNWVSHYPLEHQESLINDLKGEAHQSTFFELLLHELFWQSRCELTPHFKMQNGKKIDFWVNPPNGLFQPFYIEATLAEGVSQKEKGTKKLIEIAHDALEEVECPDYFIKVEVKGSPSEPIKLTRLKSELQNWINSLNYDDVKSYLASGAKPKEFQYEESSVALIFSAIPRNKLRGDKSVRNVGVKILPGIFIQPGDTLRSAIKDKVSRYGDLKAPYLIAVDGLSEYADTDDLINAIFGDEVYVEHVLAGGTIKQEWKRDNNALFSPSQNTRVSGIIFCRRVTPWNFAHQTVLLFKNPWAKYPITDIPASIPIWEVSAQGKLIKQNDKTIGEILGLSEGWPG